MTEGLAKGASMEEALRAYFIRNGYYTLRGVPFLYKGFDVTDVDLWLYDRPSSVSRQRIIVDVKNKKTPQAIERIFWIKGLQITLRVDQAIVATTDKRPAVSEFGKEHGVMILDGSFLSRLMSGSDSMRDRLSEEEFVNLIDSYNLGKLGGDWKGQLQSSKHLVLTGLHYNAINQWLINGRFFLEQTVLVSTHKYIACRIFYIIVSLIAIAIDFVMKDLAFAERPVKLETINNGLRYGSAGEAGTKEVLDLAMGLVEQYLPDGRGAANAIRQRLTTDFDKLHTNILADYFSRSSVFQGMFEVAKELEAAAYGRSFRAPIELTTEARSMLSVLLDFWGIERARFFDNLPPVASMASNAAATSKDGTALTPFATPEIKAGEDTAPPVDSSSP